MTPVAKVLIVASIICFLLWGAALSAGLQPLFASSGCQVTYGEGEDFFSDAVAYHKARNETFLLLNLPHARPAYRWWTVDLAKEVISLSRPPRSIGRLRFIVKGDLDVSGIAGQPQFRDWSWRFTVNGAAFSGKGFTCNIRIPWK